MPKELAHPLALISGALHQRLLSVLLIHAIILFIDRLSTH